MVELVTTTSSQQLQAQVSISEGVHCRMRGVRPGAEEVGMGMRTARGGKGTDVGEPAK